MGTPGVETAQIAAAKLSIGFVEEPECQQSGGQSPQKAPKATENLLAVIQGDTTENLSADEHADEEPLGNDE